MTAGIEVRDVVRRADPADRVKLTATVVLEGVTCRGVRLVSGRGGPVVSFPARRVGARWEPFSS